MGITLSQGQADDLSRDEFLSVSVRLAYLSAGLAVVLAVVAALMWSSNMWTALISVLVAAAQLVIAGTLPTRMRKRADLRDAGNVVVQHSWLLLSIAIAALAIYPSPFFEVTTVWFSLAMLVGLAWAIIGVYNLHRSITRAGARLTI
ncbi:hypothetical protein [Haloplanus pelagicus]|jgi:hypothetical protein|uniref:hypothetical protein n=1 Tax=Haloplanus pelagicus TaxID=2949995 RepID=UPI00203B36AC|nr:hypothetical protein [Haloplanus sp. HW8-1]